MKNIKQLIYHLNKRTFYILLVAIFFCGCAGRNSCNNPENLEQLYGQHLLVLTFDSCEYVWVYGYGNGIAHKGNCKFCAERSKHNRH